MKIGRLRHRVVFLKPAEEMQNSAGEWVQTYKPWKNGVDLNLQIDGETVFLTDGHEGNARLRVINEVPFASLASYAVWAEVAPKTGREYEESQKIRAETTYNIMVRYMPGITQDMRIRFKDHVFKIVSVLNADMKNEYCQIVAFEDDRTCEYG